MNRSPRDDWKHAAGTRPGRPGAQPPSRRRSRLRVAVISLLAAAGVAAGLFFFLRPEPKPLFLSLCVAEYDAWPVNASAQQDGESLKDYFRDGVVAYQSQEGDGLLRELDRLAERAEKERAQAVVIHVCALAVADGDTVSILPAKALPGSPGTWLPLSRVLETVGKIGGKRLLVLDLRPVADPRLGQMGIEVRKALSGQLAAAERDGKLPYLVFAQCAPAEYPFVSPELHRGILAEFLRRGLAGHADGWNEGKTTDNQVSALELLAYARGRIGHWLARHDAPSLLPVAYGTSDDFVLVSVPQRGPPTDDLPEPIAPSAKVLEGWTKIDAWRAEGAQHKTPRTFRQLEVAVSRADQLMSGGTAVEVVDQRLKDRLDELDAQRKSFEILPFPVGSVGRARRAGIAKENEIAIAVQPLMDALRVPGAKPEELKGKLDPFWKMPPEPPPYDATVSTVLKSIVDGEDLTAEQLKGYVDALRGLKPVPAQIEISTLAFFADPKAGFRKQWPGTAPRAAVRAAIAAESVAATDARALPRIDRPLADADAGLRQALLTFFQPSEPAWAQAVATMVGLTEQYETIGKLAEAYQRALFEWEEAVVLLPAVEDFSPVNPLARQAVDNAWTDLTAKTRRLREAMEGPADVDVLGRLSDDLGAQRRKALGLLREIPDGAGARELRARLRLPVWTGTERQTLTARADAAAAELARRVLGEEVSPAAIDVRSPVADDPRVAEAAARRAGRAGDLLAVAGQPAPEAGDWRAALAGRLIERYRQQSDPAVRAWCAWLIHPDDLPATPATPDGPRNDPAADARRNAELARAAWLAEKRYRPLADAMNAQPAGAGKAVAQDLYEAARRLNAWRP